MAKKNDVNWDEGRSVGKTKHTGWKRLRNIPWPVTKCCGLVGLSNEATIKAIRAGCEK